MKSKPFLLVSIFFFSMLAAGVLFSSYLLPHYVEKKVLPDLGAYLSSSVKGNVYYIGFDSTVLGDIEVGDSANIPLKIGTIQAEYTPYSLLVKKIDSITVTGLTLNLEIADGKIFMPGIDLEKLAGTKTERQVQSPPSAITLPVGLAHFQVLDGLLNIRRQNRHIFIPFALEISRQENQGSDALPVYQLDMQIFLQGLEARIAGSLDLASNTGNIDFIADSFDLSCTNILFGEKQNTLQSGTGSFSGRTRFNILPFKLDTAEFAGEIHSLALNNSPVSFDMDNNKAEMTEPVKLKAKVQGNKFDVAVQSAITKPLAASLDLEATLLNNAGALSGSGKVSFMFHDMPPSGNNGNQYLMIKDNPELSENFTLKLSSSGTWEAKLEGDGKGKDDIKTEPFRIQYGGSTLRMENPAISIMGRGSAGINEITASLDLSDIHAMLDDTTEIRIPHGGLQTSFRLESESGLDDHASGEFTLLLPDTEYTKNGLTGNADITIEGSIPQQKIQDVQSLTFSGEISALHGILEDESSSLKINALDMQIPWHWPFSGKEKNGKLKAAQITWNKKEVGRFEADIGLEDAVYSINGRHESSLIKGLETTVAGTAAFDGASFQANLSAQTKPTKFTSLHLGNIDSALTNSYLSGELGLDGSFRLDTKGVHGGISVNLQNGRLENPDKKYDVDGITMELQLPSLPDLRSTPAQKLLFDKGSFGNLIFAKGKIIWQLESAHSLFVEEGVVQWSGGRVFTSAVRISPDRKEYVVPIFCDRLILADILRQFGISNAEGEGTVSGRIPLMIDKGNIRVEDGFLYSSPGQGGSVKVSALDMLSAGIPKSSPQFAQIDFAAEALKNFKYNWVKLLLDSDGDDLIMQMQMDGKPLQSLPFTYDSQTGFLKRVEGSAKGIDQPIRLDVNFRLPLNRFLGYSGKIQDILDKVK